MGYELHITRSESWSVAEGVAGADDWSLGDENAIVREEWEALARSDARLLDLGDTYGDGSDRTPVFLWRDAHGPSLVWRDGQVDVKGVESEAVIADLVELATRLGAAIEGDDGETYDRDGSPVD